MFEALRAGQPGRDLHPAAAGGAHRSTLARALIGDRDDRDRASSASAPARRSTRCSSPRRRRRGPSSRGDHLAIAPLLPELRAAPSPAAEPYRRARVQLGRRGASPPRRASCSSTLLARIADEGHDRPRDPARDHPPEQGDRAPRRASASSSSSTPGRTSTRRSATSSSTSSASAPPTTTSAIEGEGFGARVGAILAAVAAGVRARATRPPAGPRRHGQRACRPYVAKRMGIPVLHMEAGNRCFDDRVPEEVNRRIIDQSSDVLLPYTERSRDNLLREGFHPSRVLTTATRSRRCSTRTRSGSRRRRRSTSSALEPGEYLLLTAAPPGDRRLRRPAASRCSAEVARRGRRASGCRWSSASTRGRASGSSASALDAAAAAAVRAVRLLRLRRARARRALRAHRQRHGAGGVLHHAACPTVTVRDTTERPETVECGSNVLSGVGVGGVAPALRLALERPTDWRIPPEYEVANVSSVVARDRRRPAARPLEPARSTPARRPARPAASRSSAPSTATARSRSS